MRDKPIRRKPGPKPFSKRELRSLLVGIPVNAEEMKTLRKAVGRGSLAAWARTLLLRGATEDPTPINYPAPKRATRKGAK